MYERMLTVIGLTVLAIGSVTACSPAIRSVPNPASPMTPPVTSTNGTATTNATTTGATSGNALNTGYVTYRNERFGFSVAVPSSFAAGTPPQNGDGMSFSPKDRRVTLSVYGSNNVLGDTPASAAASYVAQQKSKGSRVTLNSVHGDHFTASGYDSTGTTIWYEHKIVFSNVEYGIDWEYPASLASQIDPQVTATVRSYVPGPNRAG
ncbi:hypothetical protein EV186_10995 [Labedaea rhizosphaerae]|uniref:Uncharacterized protein n=2 Tax=Labedaea rhizosphaerae TaxID=598644 RepID=A0A4R6RVY6_LABRH|nr:hypothetical protein EV186_10995 [Labedaea rhizosphaerae]